MALAGGQHFAARQYQDAGNDPDCDDKQACGRVIRVIDSEAGDQGADEIGRGADHAEIAEVARAFGGLAHQADQVLREHVQNRERKAA